MLKPRATIERQDPSWGFLALSE